jgi:hypothetical protein
MDRQRLKRSFDKLQALDERLTYKVRPRSSFGRKTTEQLEDDLRHLAEYTIELKEVLHEVILAVATEAKAAPPKPGA